MFRNLRKAARSKATQGRTGLAALSGTLVILVIWIAEAQRTVGASTQTANTIKGFGNPNFISKFLDNVTIGSSGIYEYLGNIGIGTTNPQAKLDVLSNVCIEGTGSGFRQQTLNELDAKESGWRRDSSTMRPQSRLLPLMLMS